VLTTFLPGFYTGLLGLPNYPEVLKFPVFVPLLRVTKN